MRVRRVLAGVWWAVAAACLARAAPAPVSAPRHVRIAVVDADKIGFARELEKCFAEQLYAAMGGASVDQSAPTLEALGAREAALRLKSGACDAVLFLGPHRPGVLRTVEGATLAGLCGHVFASTPVYLIVPAGDPQRRKILADAFSAALGEVPRRGRMPAAE